MPWDTQERSYRHLHNSFRKKEKFAQKRSWIKIAKGCYHWVSGPAGRVGLQESLQKETWDQAEYLEVAGRVLNQGAVKTVPFWTKSHGCAWHPNRTWPDFSETRVRSRSDSLFDVGLERGTRRRSNHRNHNPRGQTLERPGHWRKGTHWGLSPQWGDWSNSELGITSDVALQTWRSFTLKCDGGMLLYQLGCCLEKETLLRKKRNEAGWVSEPRHGREICPPG